MITWPREVIYRICHRHDFLVWLWNGLIFFELFLTLFSLGIDHDPPCSHDLCLFLFSYVSFFTRSQGQEKSLSCYDLFDFGVLSILRTHPHFHSPLLPFRPHHPYTHLPSPRSTDRSEGESLPDATCGEAASPDYKEEDYARPRLTPAMVELVLPSKKSGQPGGRYYREPLLAQARFGRQ